MSERRRQFVFVGGSTVKESSPLQFCLWSLIPPLVVSESFPTEGVSMPSLWYSRLLIPLQPKRRPLYLKTQSVPRCKHFSSGL